MALAKNMLSLMQRLLNRPRQIGEEEFKEFRRYSFDPVSRRGACYVPMPGFESSVHYRDKQNLHHLGRYEWAAHLLAGENGAGTGRVLDCACGVGFGSRMLAEVFDEVSAVDVFEPAIELARERYDDARITWHCLDVADLRETFKEESFDAIVSMQTIEFIEDDKKFLDDLRELLKPGGVLLIDTPIRAHRVENPENPHHKRYYSLDDWFSLLESRFEIKAFDSLPEVEFLKARKMPSMGSVVYCQKPL